MNYIEILSKLQEVFDVIMIISIIFIYTIHVYFRWKIYKESEKTQYSLLLIYFIAVSVMFILVFLYLLGNILLGNPIVLTSYGILLIRPVIFLTGCVLVSSARATLINMRVGGCLWTLRKPKI